MNLAGRSKWILFATITVVGFALDWLTKYLAVSLLTPGLPSPVISPYFEWLLVFNKGAIFGLNPRAWAPNFPINAFFYFFSGIAVILLVAYYHNLKSASWRMYLGVSLIMPGALGNLFDRVIFPGRGVVDFIKVGISQKLYWPIFNLADTYITVGVILILLDLVIDEWRRKTSEKSTEIQTG
jgi:signal peptidase II